MQDRFWEDFLIEGTEDEIDLWEVIKDIKSQYSEKKPLEIQSMTLEAIRKILETVKRKQKKCNLKNSSKS